MDQTAHSTPTTTSGITTSSFTTAPTSKSVIVDPSSSDEKNSSFIASSLHEAHETPKRVSSSTISSPLLTPPGKVLGRNYNGTSE